MPIGLRTPFAESLASYLVRLAESHSVYPATLLHCLLIPALKLKQDIPQNYRDKPLLNSILNVINGTGFWAQHMSEVFSEWTGLPDVRFLTMSTWRQVISRRKLLKHTRAWCPECYSASHQSQSPVYDPLLWSIATVVACPIHRAPLEHLCPICSTRQPIVALMTGLDQCTQCGSPLITRSNAYAASSSQTAPPDPSEYLPVIDQIGGLIACMPDITVPTSHSVADGLRRCYEILGSGSLSEMCSRAGFNRSHGGNLWRVQRHMPNLQAALDVSDVLNLSLAELLSGQPNLTRVSLREPTRTALRSKRTTLDKAGIGQALQHYVNLKERMALESLAAQLHCTRGYMRRQFPKLYRKIAAQNKKLITTNSKSKLSNQIRSVKRLTKLLHKRGETPTVKVIEKTIGVRHLDKSALEARRETLRELGYFVHRRVKPRLTTLQKEENYAQKFS